MSITLDLHGINEDQFVDIFLNKKQLQETLRQMGISPVPTASKEELISRLQQANQHQWMTLAKNDRVIRKKSGERKKKESLEPVSQGRKKDSVNVPCRKKYRTTSHRPRIWTGANRENLEGKSDALPVESDTAPPDGTRTKDVRSPQYLKVCVLQRANGICELCDTPEMGNKLQLKVCDFVNIPDEAYRTIKDMAALCPDCHSRVLSQRLPKDIKILKRKARRKRIADVKVEIRKRS